MAPTLVRKKMTTSEVPLSARNFSRSLRRGVEGGCGHGSEVSCTV